MKKSLFAMLCLISLASFAQTKKGDKLVGVGIGSISYTNGESKTTYSNIPDEYKNEGSSFSVSVYPNVAWFVQDNLAIGGGVNVSFYTSKSDNSNTGSPYTSENKSSQPSFYIGPMARYYFGGSPKGMPFAQVNFQYGIYGGKNKFENSTGNNIETKTKSKGDWNAGLGAGYEHFVTQNIGIYGSIGFTYAKSKTTYEYRPSTGMGYDYTTVYSRFYIPVGVGIQVHILGKKAK